VRIGNQTGAWFKGPCRCGSRAYSAGLGLGGGGDGDVVVGVEGAELVQEAAGPAVGVGLAGVPVGAEFGVAGLGIGEEVLGDDEDGASHGASGPGAAEAA
jgi:hypothetical protein